MGDKYITCPHFLKSVNLSISTFTVITSLCLYYITQTKRINHTKTTKEFTMSYITFENIYKKFGQTEVLSDVNFSIDQGEICGFAGRNGSGKTMIFKILAGLVIATSGKVTFCGEDISQSGKFISSMGIMIETPGFIPHYSGLKNLLILNDLSVSKTDKKHIMELMTRLGLDPKNKQPVKTYSLGMRQKLGIIQAVMNSPELLVLDEPMNSLDEETVNMLREFFKELNKEKNTTILIASHIKEDLTSLCTKMYSVANNSVTLETE